jgi:DNA-binding MarR family transcriptional regulator
VNAEDQLAANTLPDARARALHGIRSLIAALSRSARAVEQRTGITNAQLFILRELADTDALTINALAERAMTGQNTVSAVVTRLEKRRLVSRGRSRADGRVVTVTISAAGRRLVQRAPEPVTGRLLDVLRALPANDVRTVAHAMTVLNDGLGLRDDADAAMLFENEAQEAERGARRR